MFIGKLIGPHDAKPPMAVNNKIFFFRFLLSDGFTDDDNLSESEIFFSDKLFFYFE